MNNKTGKKLRSVLAGMPLLCLLLLLCSCGPQTTDVTLHIDEDVFVTKIVFAKVTSGISVEVKEEFENLELTKGDSVVCQALNGQYAFFIICNKEKSVYKGPKNYFNRYNRVLFSVNKGESCDVYLTDSENGFTIY